jgi:2-polyprenyl-6-methoxyphenol hydroxylase-like FAD-dependent oxidoreductase
MKVKSSVLAFSPHLRAIPEKNDDTRSLFKKGDEMRVVIVGGGVSGLATQIALNEAGISSRVYERSAIRERMGHGFILLSNGLESLREIGLQDSLTQFGQSIHEFRLKSNRGEFMGAAELKDAMGFRRNEFIQMLENRIPSPQIQMECDFSHFEFDPSGFARRACFSDGEKVEGDLFIAADGIHSKIRTVLFPQAQLSDGRVKELVGHVRGPGLVQAIGPTLTKFQDPKGGLAFGVLPASSDSLVWYMQFDSQKVKSLPQGSEEKKKFAQTLVGTWADPIPEVLESTDFSLAHFWNTKDLEVLPEFYSKNIALMGDSAHAFLPFTSQGVNSALQDSIILGIQLQHVKAGRIELKQALQNFSDLRKPAATEYLRLGRELAAHFLEPITPESSVQVPLCK